MSVWMEIYNEADQIIKQYRAKSISLEQFQAVGSGLSLKLKAARGEASCEMASMKSVKLRNSLKSKRLLANDGTAMGGLSMLSLEEERVKCEEKQDKLITRSECLEYSGHKEHIDDCKQCEHFSVTRDLILGPKE